MRETSYQPSLFPDLDIPVPEPVDVHEVAKQIGKLVNSDPSYNERSDAARSREAERMGLLDKTDQEPMNRATRHLPQAYLNARKRFTSPGPMTASEERKELKRGVTASPETRYRYKVDGRDGGSLLYPPMTAREKRAQPKHYRR